MKCLAKKCGTEQEDGKILETKELHNLAKQNPFTYTQKEKEQHNRKQNFAVCQGLSQKVARHTLFSNNGVNSTSNPEPQISTLLSNSTNYSRTQSRQQHLVRHERKEENNNSNIKEGCRRNEYT